MTRKIFFLVIHACKECSTAAYQFKTIYSDSQLYSIFISSYGLSSIQINGRTVCNLLLNDPFY